MNSTMNSFFQMNLNQNELNYWNSYLKNLRIKPLNAKVIADVAGNNQITDALLALYLNGKKPAGSGLVKAYEFSNENLPEVGNYWIILDSTKNPRCLVKTIGVEIHQFDQVPESIAIAEGEGDLSLEHWRKVHMEFFSDYLNELKIVDLNKEKIVTEFFEIVQKN